MGVQLLRSMIANCIAVTKMAATSTILQVNRNCLTTSLVLDFVRDSHSVWLRLYIITSGLSPPLSSTLRKAPKGFIKGSDPHAYSLQLALFALNVAL